jgi:hypothetical protein
MRSMSSCCLILMPMRTEFTEGSMRTCSFSLREITSGLRRTSREVLKGMVFKVRPHLFDRRCAGTYPASTSGLLCRSTTWFIHEILTYNIVKNPGSPYLRREVLQSECCGEGSADCRKIWPQRGGLNRGNMSVSLLEHLDPWYLP